MLIRPGRVEHRILTGAAVYERAPYDANALASTFVDYLLPTEIPHIEIHHLGPDPDVEAR